MKNIEKLGHLSIDKGKRTFSQKLAVRRETIRRLEVTELCAVRGGGETHDSNCIIWSPLPDE